MFRLENVGTQVSRDDYGIVRVERSAILFYICVVF